MDVVYFFSSSELSYLYSQADVNKKNKDKGDIYIQNIKE